MRVFNRSSPTVTSQGTNQVTSFSCAASNGIATGKIRRQADLPQLMIEPMKEMAGFYRDGLPAGPVRRHV